MKYDKDHSGDIDVAEVSSWWHLRHALRRLLLARFQLSLYAPLSLRPLTLHLRVVPYSLASDSAQLRPALRRLGLPADTETANAILRWYDADESGRIELHEFAVLARDVSVFTSYDKDRSGNLDATELRPALAKLGLAASESEVRRRAKAASAAEFIRTHRKHSTTKRMLALDAPYTFLTRS